MTRLQEFLKALSDKGAKTYYVGGYVRDMILGKENKDIEFITLQRKSSLMCVSLSI